jgi:hypothetical protein
VLRLLPVSPHNLDSDKLQRSPAISGANKQDHRLIIVIFTAGPTEIARKTGCDIPKQEIFMLPG